VTDEPPVPEPVDDVPIEIVDYPPMLGESRLLTDEELAVSREAMLKDWDRKTDLWLFGYGSLIWNPGLPTVEAVRSRVHGYHRGLYLWSRVNRGTPDQPGLVLALDRGGSCTGIAFRLAAADAESHLEVLWRREMAMGSYRPAWLPCTLADGRRVDALAFVMRRDVPTYTGKLDDPIVRHVFGCATGRYGTTLDYVSRTVQALRESGMPDRALEALLRRCEEKEREKGRE
jgi:glutathione-specific gamma-glutamylcyclotransferase